jgi:hypothetical protein
VVKALFQKEVTGRSSDACLPLVDLHEAVIIQFGNLQESFHARIFGFGSFAITLERKLNTLPFQNTQQLYTCGKLIN